jgi:hypothetical protein
MRSLRAHLINTAALIGMISAGLLLLNLTGFLIGAVTPRLITTVLATWATKIAASQATWWLASLLGWFIFGWSAWLLLTFRLEAPVLIREDEIGTVEVAPEALAGLARAEVAAQGSPRPFRAEFIRKMGKPILQVWVDLTLGGDSDGPVARGEKLKADIERRLREDFSLNSVRVEVIHMPVNRVRPRCSPVAAA